jgi:hypothetical protein
MRMEFFEYNHLPENLKEVSKPICKLAHEMDKNLVNNEEKAAGMRKLMEAKDCFVRSMLINSQI